MSEEETLPEVNPGEESVTTEAETTDVETEESAASEETTEETSAEPPKKSKGVQKRLDEITRLRYEAERRAEQERQERLYWQQKAMGETKPSAPVNKPTVDQYGTYEEYLEALSDWKVDQRLASERAERERQQQEESQRSKAMTYKERASKAREKYDDYEQIAHGSHWSPTQSMTEAIVESEMGPDIAYYLGNNPEEAERISKLSPAGQHRELGKLEAKLSAPPPPKPTKAPPPIEPTGSRAKAEKSPDEMNPQEFAEWRKRYINQRR